MASQGQGLYRGGENKKVKLTKAEKVWNAMHKTKASAPVNVKKETPTA